MLTDERYKQLMNDVGMPESKSLLQALKQAAREAALFEREQCAKLIEPKNPRHDWTDRAEIMAECAERIRGQW